MFLCLFIKIVLNYTFVIYRLFKDFVIVLIKFGNNILKLLQPATVLKSVIAAMPQLVWKLHAFDSSSNLSLK